MAFIVAVAVVVVDAVSTDVMVAVEAAVLTAVAIAVALFRRDRCGRSPESRSLPCLSSSLRG